MFLHATPQNAAQFNVDGACFTGPQQLLWVLELTKKPGQFVLHMDGKHKLHHGVWILITLGTHYLRNKGKESVRLTHSFAPLVYLFCKQHETRGPHTKNAQRMLWDQAKNYSKNTMKTSRKHLRKQCGTSQETIRKYVDI